MSGSLIAAGFGAFSILRSSFAEGRITLVQVTGADGLPVLSTDGKPIYQAFNTYIAMEEAHSDELHITDHPVAQGSVISDHAFMMPAQLTMIMAWSPSNPNLSGNITVFGVTLPSITGLFDAPGQGLAQLRDIYDQVRAVQRSRSRLTIFTGKRKYDSMLVRTVSEVTTSHTENSLELSVSFRQILIARIKTFATPVNLAPGAQAIPQSTQPVSPGGTKTVTSAPPATPFGGPVFVN